MVINSVQQWVENAEKGIVQRRPGYVLTSSKMLKELGKSDQAEAILRRAVKEFPDEIKILTDLCSTVVDKNPNEVLELIKTSGKKDAGLLVMEATALGRIDEHIKAISLLEKETESNPQLKYEQDIASKLTTLYLEKGMDKKAVDFLAPLVEEGHFKGIKMRQILADAYIKIRKPDKALVTLDNLRDPRSQELIRRAQEILGGVEPSRKTQKKIFIVHGSNHDIRDKIDLFLTKDLGLKTEVMEAGPHAGRTLPEKFEEMANQCGFAIFILTADDELIDKSKGKEIKRARQNVILEVGYFWGVLGRKKHVAFLVEKDEKMDLPADIQGLGWIPITQDLALTKQKLQKELEVSGLL